MFYSVFRVAFSLRQTLAALFGYRYVVLLLLAIAASESVVHAQSDSPPVNNIPVSEDDHATTAEDTPVSVPVLANDTDADGDQLTVESVAAGLHGMVATDGTLVIYTPTLDYNGLDSFTYTVSDGAGGMATGTVTVTVTPVNDSPSATSVHIDTTEDNASQGFTPDVNDVDRASDEEQHTFAIVTSPEHGVASVVTVAQAGQVRLGWNAVNAPSLAGYIIYYALSASSVDDPGSCLDALVDVDTLDVSATETTVSVFGLEPGETYCFGVKAYNDVGQESSFSNTLRYQLPQAGQLVYSPAPDFNGTDSFSYQATDSQGASVIGTAQVVVLPVNDVPLSGDDRATTSEDTALNVDVLTNDTDVDGDDLMVESVVDGVHGTVTTDGTFVTYTPAPDYHGTDAFTYTVSDGMGGRATSTVAMTITSVNDPPMVTPGTVVSEVNTAVDVAIPATDVDGDVLTVINVTQGTHGTVTIADDGTVGYLANPDFSGQDTFTYTVTDGNGGIATGTIAVTVAYAPTAVDDTATTAEDTAVNIDVLANDTDVAGESLQVSDFTQGANGNVEAIANHTLIYTPTTDFTGTDVFSYTVTNGEGLSATATVTVSVNPVNDTPVTVDDSATTAEDSAIDIAVLSNDTDVDDDELTVVDVSAAQYGTVTTDGTLVTYAPTLDYSGTDHFTYTVGDGAGGRATGTVIVTVMPVNDAPLAMAQSVTVAAETPMEIVLTGNDVDGDLLVYAIVTEPGRGVLSGTPPVITYTPDADFNGRDGFTFRVNDGLQDSAPASVAIIVIASELPNGGFESSDFTHWETRGETRVETLAFGRAPTEGNFQAFLSTAGPVEGAEDLPGNAVAVSELEGFLGLPLGSLDNLSTDTVVEGSAVKQTFAARAGDVVSFDWNFLTNEYTHLDEPEASPRLDHNDLSFVSITLAAAPADTVPLAESTWTFILSSTSFSAETGFDTYSFTLPATGTYTLGIGVVDVGDGMLPSGLLLDNVLLTPASP